MLLLLLCTRVQNKQQSMRDYLHSSASRCRACAHTHTHPHPMCPIHRAVIVLPSDCHPSAHAHLCVCAPVWDLHGPAYQIAVRHGRGSRQRVSPRVAGTGTRARRHIEIDMRKTWLCCLAARCGAITQYTHTHVRACTCMCQLGLGMCLCARARAHTRSSDDGLPDMPSARTRALTCVQIAYALYDDDVELHFAPCRPRRSSHVGRCKMKMAETCRVYGCVAFFCLCFFLCLHACSCT